jgi:hypothetical protein
MLEAIVFALVMGVGVYMVYTHMVKKDEVKTPPTGPMRPIPGEPGISPEDLLEEMNKSELVAHLKNLDPKAKTSGMSKVDLIARIKEL